MKRSNVINLFLLFLALFVISARPAHAYLDPGSGSYILQILIATGVGALFAVKTFWLQIKDFFTSLIGRKKQKTKSAPKNNDMQ
ncbi:MAG: hypothetical protein WD231_01575 [Candidatus Woykebacteria bacterium]